MKTKSDLLQMLKKESIDFSITEHEPLFTVEDSKLMRGKIEGGHSKNLFLNTIYHWRPNQAQIFLQVQI